MRPNPVKWLEYKKQALKNEAISGLSGYFLVQKKWF
jgi:hypothetical protein